MALIQLVNETKLKTLKFGADRPQGGSSPEPFIRENIPGTVNQGGLQGVLTGITTIAGTLPSIFDPGILLATQASVTDTVRLGKFFATPKGLVFTAKQNLLSRIAVRTQASGLLNDYAYLPTSTLAQAGVNVFGGHLNKQGENPFLGLGRPYTPNRYFDAITNGNRPVLTFEPKTITVVDALNPDAGPYDITRRVLRTELKPVPERLPDLLRNSFKDPPFLMKYPGGPGSRLGVGQTIINFATDNNGFVIRTNSSWWGGNREAFESRTGTRTWESDTLFEVTGSGYTPIVREDFRKVLRQSYVSRIRGEGALDVPALESFLEDDQNDSSKFENTTMAAARAPKYVINGQTNIEARVNLNNPAAPGRNLAKYEEGTGKQTYDLINAFPIYKSDTVSPQSLGPKVNDLVKFRIAAISNDNPILNEYIHFRAFLGSVSDNYSADWDSVQYMGRGDKLYNYRGFNRTISLSWTVAAQSKTELIPMYHKLNFLASNLAPDYNDSGYMRGPLVSLTIGGYLYEVPGFINSMTLEMSEETPWEIAITSDGKEDVTVKELPHIIRVSGFTFTPIHRFIPRKQRNTYGGNYVANPTPDQVPKQDQGVIKAFDRTRFISLAAGTQTKSINYDPITNIIY